MDFTGGSPWPEPPETLETPQDLVCATSLFHELQKNCSANEELLMHNLLMIWNTHINEPNLPLLAVDKQELSCFTQEVVKYTGKH